MQTQSMAFNEIESESEKLQIYKNSQIQFPSLFNMKQFTKVKKEEESYIVILK